MKWLDGLGYRLATWWTPALQVRTGTLLTLLGFAFGVLTPFAVWAGGVWLLLLTYVMSFLALVLGGMGILVTAVLAVKTAPDVSEEDLNPER